MIVGAVEIDEEFAEAFEDLDGHRGAVDELLVGATGADGALDEEFAFLTGVEAGFY